jgi:hypothetical protein
MRPSDPIAYADVGYMYERLGDGAKAVQAYETVLTLGDDLSAEFRSQIALRIDALRGKQ